MDLTWTDASERDIIDYIALVLIGLALLVCSLLSFGAMVAPFVVSTAYSEHYFGTALAAAGLGVLVAIYLLITWVPAPDWRSVGSTILLIAGVSFISVNTGLPATIGSVTGETQTIIFDVLRASSGTRHSCRGIIVGHPGYDETKLCYVRAQPGMRVQLTGRVSWFGLRYSDVQVLD